MFSLTAAPVPILITPDSGADYPAEQLAYYLAIITGNRFSVENEPAFGADCASSASQGPVIHLQTDLVADKKGTFCVHVTDKDLILAGDDRLSALHAVYYFLEKYCGCRWLSEWDGGEIVPRNTSLALSPGEETIVPAFTNRAFTNYPDINRNTVTMLDWMTKNRFNRFMVFANVPEAFDAYRKYLRDEAMLRGILVEMGHHSFKFWLPSSEFYATNPEFFALKNGQRIPDGQLCTSNPAVIERVYERIAAFFEANPEFDRVGLWPNDCFGWCECEACQALEPQMPATVYTQEARRTDTYMRFVNAVAQRLAQSHPDKRLSALAYLNYVEPPSFDIAPNVDVCFAPIQRCFKHPFEGHPDCTRPNAQYAGYFEDWRPRVAGALYLFEYTMLIDMCSLPVRLTDMYPDNWAWLARHGCDGYVMEFVPEEWGVYGLNGYLLGRYAWEPNLDLAAFLRGHYEAIYGPAAEEMAAFWEEFLQAFTRPGPCTYHYDLTYTCRATEELLRPALEHLGRARAQATVGEKRHWRAVEQARVSTELLLHFGEWQRSLREAQAAPEGTGKREVLSADARRAAQELLAFAESQAKSGAVYLPRIEAVVGTS